VPGMSAPDLTVTLEKLLLQELISRLGQFSWVDVKQEL